MQITKYLLVLVIVLLLGGVLQTVESKKLPLLVYPKNLLVKNNRILITDYPNVYLYSLKDFRLVKKFGSIGEGPGEFYVDQISLNTKFAGLVSGMTIDHIYVNSQGRLSIFDLKGEFLKMIKPEKSRMGMAYKPAGDGFAALHRVRTKGRLYSTVKLFDQTLKEVQELTRTPFWIKDFSSFSSRGFDYFERANGSISLFVNSDKIYASPYNLDKIVISVFNQRGEKQKTINYKTKKVTIPIALKKKIRVYYRIKFKRGLDANLKATRFPENFPPLRKFFVEKNKIYLLTYYREGDLNEIIVLDINGNFLYKKMIPVQEANPEHLYPCDIHQGNFYQIVEVGDEEEWELHITKIQEG